MHGLDMAMRCSKTCDGKLYGSWLLGRLGEVGLEPNVKRVSSPLLYLFRDLLGRYGNLALVFELVLNGIIETTPTVDRGGGDEEVDSQVVRELRAFFFKPGLLFGETSLSASFSLMRGFKMAGFGALIKLCGLEPKIWELIKVDDIEEENIYLRCFRDSGFDQRDALLRLEREWTQEGL